MERTVTAQELAAGIWRRKGVVAAIALGVFAAGAAIVAALPNEYRATSVVRVEAARPSHDLVTPSVTTPIEDRLKTARQELLARPLLEKTITELDLYPKLRARYGMEGAVEELRKNLDVKVEGENAFELSVKGDNAEQVAKVANRLPELFAEQTLEVRERQAKIAAGLFDTEIEKLAKELEDQEAKLAAFKVEHLGELPEQAEPNMRALERITAALRLNNESYREVLRRQGDLEQARFAADTEFGRMKRREDDLVREQSTVRSQWTDDHPEVQRVARELESIRAKRAAAESRARQDDAERSSLRGQLASLQREAKSLEAEAQMYRERIDATPKWGHDIAVLTRDYEMAKNKYQSLVSRKIEAEIARELEAKAKQGMFHVLSAASVPVLPAKPDRAAGIALALLAGLAAGLLFGIFRELQDDSLRRLDHARDLQVPVLAVVPNVPVNKQAAN